MRKERNRPKDIELRSDEVRELMGRVPPFIQRVGISVILLIVIGLFVASAFIKYPTYIPVKARTLPNDSFETILCPQNGTIISMKRTTVSLVHPEDTLCILLTDKNDTLPIQSNCLGKASCLDIFVQGMYVEANTRLFIIERDTDERTIGTDFCVYLPYKTSNKYSVGDKIRLKLDGIVYDLEIMASTIIPNEQGERVIRCHSETQLPKYMFWGASNDVELQVDNKSIYETFIRERLFH